MNTGACDKAGHDPQLRSDGWVYCRRCHTRLYKGGGR